MLILSRRVGQSIYIGDDIVVTVMQSRHGRAQIGVRAPSDVPVYRLEIIKRMIARGEMVPGDQRYAEEVLVMS